MYDHSEVCLGCGEPMTAPFLDLNVTPLANAYVSPDRAASPEKSFPLAVAFCPACYLVQLTGVVDPTELFAEYSYFSSYSSTYLAHASEMAGTLADRFRLNADSRVLEIASNDGYLLQYFRQRHIPVLGIEPAANIARFAQERDIPTLNRFFNAETAEVVLNEFGRADVIIANNVVAHVPRINDFLKAVHQCLKPGGYAVFEFPYLLDLLEHCEFDTIYHEHIFYYSLAAVDILAKRAGLRLVDAEHQTVHGGTIRVYLTGAADAPRPTLRLAAMLEHERAAGLTDAARYRDFSAQVAEIRSALCTLLESLRAEGKSIAAYGAPAKGNTLLNYCKIGRNLIDFTVDRSPHKQNRLLPGSHIPVFEPGELLRRQPDYTLILPWNIGAEIIEDQAEYVAAGGRFIIPIPKPVVLTGESQPALV
jgi:SAM-dependent methyltransferase